MDRQQRWHLDYGKERTLMDLMIDIETLATNPDAVVLTIGAIKFDPFADNRDSVDFENKEINMDVFYRRIDPESFTWPEATIDNGTLEWWARQADDVKEEAFAEDGRVSIQDAMLDFRRWVGEVDSVWANGPAFDIVILESHAKHIKRAVPWKYYQVKDTRTVYGLVEHERPGHALHHAAWDCWSQIVALQSCFRNLNITKYPSRR